MKNLGQLMKQELLLKFRIEFLHLLAPKKSFTILKATPTKSIIWQMIPSSRNAW